MKIRAPYIPIEEIHRKADEFRKKYNGEKIPVDIFYIAEIELGIEVLPIQDLQKTLGIDTLITSSFETIYVDKDQYMNESQEVRLRFSIAHELGHFVLHREFHSMLNIADLEGYIKYMQDIPREEYFFLEQHANEFAGRLLVPVDRLHQKVVESRKRVPSELLKKEHNGLVISYMAREIAEEFSVSDDVIEKRINKEKLMEENG